MELEVKWSSPVLLAQNKKLVFEDEEDLNWILEQIPSRPGVYYFSRKFGVTYQPFYIGETMDLRSRLKTHLKTADIKDILRGMKIPNIDVKNGKKFFHYGESVGKKGQQAKRCIDLIQRYMIREAVANTFPLLNVHLTVIKTHSVSFSGSKAGRSPFPDEFKVAV